MIPDQELKIVFTGPMGAGKTTAIRSISDAPPVSTEVLNTDRSTCSKESTTVALDYGQLLLDDGTSVRLYGTPGQERFSFMWEILCNGSLGVILLIDGSSTTALTDLHHYADVFRNINPDRPFVIGVSRMSAQNGVELDHYAHALAAKKIVAPLFGVDVRNRDEIGRAHV